MDSTTLLIIGIAVGALLVGLGIYFYPRLLVWMNKDAALNPGDTPAPSAPVSVPPSPATMG